MLTFVRRITKCFAARQKCRGQPFLQFRSSTGHFYVVDSYIKADNNENNNKKATYYCVPMDTLFTATLRNVTCTYTVCVCVVPVSSQSANPPGSGV